LLLTSAKALASRTVDKQLFVAKSQVFNTNETINPVQLVQYFQSIGYRLETIVNNPGEISWRGSILDVYPISASNPVRMDFFGNTIDEIRLFDVSSQRSFEKVDAIRVEPASEMLPALGAEPAEINQRLSVLDLNGLKESERQRAIDDIEKLKKAQNFAGAEYYSSLVLNDCILDYLGQDTIVITDSLAGIEGVLNNINSEEDRQYTIYKEKQEAPIGLPLMHHQQPEISKRLELFVSVNVEQWQSDSISSVHRLPFSSARHFGGRYQAMVDEITSLAADNKRVVVISHQTERL
jgi:transcription-repair coupling factor (superfamily II helicase)